MKEYKKTYEDVFTSERLNKKSKIEDIESKGDMDKAEYFKKFYDTVRVTQMISFNQWVKVYWLMINFSYKGLVRKNILPTNHVYEAAFSGFCRNSLNFNRRFFTHSFYFNKVVTYFVDFYPDYFITDPFKVDYKYPFKFMTLDCLVLVYQLPERMELLKIGEDKKLTYPEFIDYTVNYILCRNEELDTKDYSVQLPRDLPPYIKYENYANNRNIKRKNSRKRK